MADIHLLNNVDHADLRVVTTRGARWGDAINQVPVMPTEFASAQRDFPILFRRGADGQFVALAILGLDRDENLFLDGDRWTSRYIPALLARGPFSIGLQQRDDGTREPMIHVDRDDPRVGTQVGERLFREHGGNSFYLDQVAEVLRALHAGHAAQAPMFAAFAEAGLLEPARIELTLNDTLRYDLADFQTIGLDALHGLRGAALDRLHERGFLAAAIHVASSLGNFERLIALKNQQRAGA
ncbi:SapC family protein [Sphingomonas nostoxanthinifaciens]|uniref:SapC family protein n=1 Tax=Sphingomonas nostoxanthinifaciens TaxID=2872652 RepID=UPI001CC20AD3|nr:SapC family protein [Sphingomonas nostoxanthinifaciens]UAK23379.1 SapC family protein [Sphingomonas nostoxanthinifaciens]